MTISKIATGKITTGKDAATKIAALGIVAVTAVMFPPAARAAISPFDTGAAPAGTVTTVATTVEEFEKQLKRRSDDGTLDERDLFELRKFRESLEGPNTSERRNERRKRIDESRLGPNYPRGVQQQHRALTF